MNSRKKKKKRARKISLYPPVIHDHTDILSQVFYPSYVEIWSIELTIMGVYFPQVREDVPLAWQEKQKKNED